MSKIVPGISPSMMCADALNLGADAVALEQAGAQFFHYDVMDGDFVPNFMLGPDVIRAVRKVSAVPADIHLMVKNPERHLHLFDLRPGDVVSVHQESTVHLQRALSAIRAAGTKAAVALNPATPLCAIEDVLPDLDMVLLMTVNPGFAGQKLVPATLPRSRGCAPCWTARGIRRCASRWTATSPSRTRSRCARRARTCSSRAPRRSSARGNRREHGKAARLHPVELRKTSEGFRFFGSPRSFWRF